MTTKPMSDEQRKDFKSLLSILSADIYHTSEDHGFLHNNEDATYIALMHSELSEALEGIRHQNPTDKHCPEYGNIEIELADCVIRILNFGYSRGLDIPGAILAKTAFNATRSWKHGGKEF